MITNNFTLTSANYLSNLDYINKYNLIDTYNFPKVEFIKLRLNSEDLMNSSISLNSKERINHLLFRAYIFLYILSNFFAKLKVVKNKTQKNALENSEDTKYVFEIILNKQEHINFFLQKLATETSFVKNNLNATSLSNITIQNGNTCTLNTRISLSQIAEIKEITFTQFSDLNIEKLNLHTNIIYHNIPKKVTKVNSLAQNMFFFA